MQKVRSTKKNETRNTQQGQAHFLDKPTPGVGFPYLIRNDSKINKTLKILIDTILKNRNELPIYNRVSTVNGYSIIKEFHMITIFDTRYTSYKI